MSLSDYKQWFIKQTIGWNHVLTQVKSLMNEKMIVHFTQPLYIFIRLLNDAPSLIFPRRMSVAVAFIWHILSMLPLLRLKCCIATEKNSFKYFG